MAAKGLKDKVDALLQAEGRLMEGARTSLRAGKRSVVLIGQDGEMTKAGEYYERATGQELGPGGYDRSQVPQRVGNTEYVKLRNGKRVKTRIWDEASGEYNFTKQGDTFYKEIYRNYVVQVPVTIVGKRANGTQYTISSQLPLEKLGLTRKTLPLNLTHKLRIAKIKDLVEDVALGRNAHGAQ